MTAAHQIRGRLHSARLHLTYLERTFAKRGSDADIVETVNATADELRQLERLVLALLALHEDDDLDV